MPDLIVSGLLTDVLNEKIFAASIHVRDGRISSIKEISDHGRESLPYIIPGFIDSHVHIESSMLTPAEFARLAVTHGTVATVSDPHEIANVCGIDGVHYMIENGRTVPFKFFFGAPSCVPATVFETAGAELNAAEVNSLLRLREVKYLSEMMNFPGVLNGDEEVLKKIANALNVGKPVDGHAPGLRGDQARKYIAAGITTDHECFTADEALDKLKNGMKIIIREGSAAKNFNALIDLLHEYPDMMMFCSDDKHPDSLVQGHINELCARGVARGIDVFKVLKAACVNPVLHYQLDVGLLKEGDAADFVLVSDLNHFSVLQTYIDGKLVAAAGKSNIERAGDPEGSTINNFHCNLKQPQDFEIRNSRPGNDLIPVIGVIDGQLITEKLFLTRKIVNDRLVSDPQSDILKIVVVNRYAESVPIAKGFIRNFGLKKGALASSVAHDSHNIVAVGVDDESLCRAVNLIISSKGGISCVNENEHRVIELPIAGLMSSEDGYTVAESYTAIDTLAKQQGCTLTSPFMSLSFMALLVIPHLKLSDLGLFDGDAFEFVRY